MRAFFSLLAATVAIAAAKAAETPAQEIEFLIGYIDRADVRFIRGRAEYSAREAADHMRTKLARAGGRVKTAEDFINGVASKSYFMGAPYKVKLPSGEIVPTGPWLTRALASRRQALQRKG